MQVEEKLPSNKKCVHGNLENECHICFEEWMENCKTRLTKFLKELHETNKKTANSKLIFKEKNENSRKQL